MFDDLFHVLDAMVDVPGHGVPEALLGFCQLVP